MDDITVDLSIHEAIGMTIITTEEHEMYREHMERLPPSNPEWPKDELFDPRGITLEEACKAAELCYGK